MGSARTLTMGSEFMGAPIKDDPDGIPSVPPGFESMVSFSLQMIQENASTSEYTLNNTSKIQSDVNCSSASNEKFKKSLRNRPCVDYSQFDCSSDEESDYELIKQDISRGRGLPKGVIRGCAECQTCQEVTARWHPEISCRPNIDEAPVFYPTEEEFQDTLKYIASIRPRAEPYGVCRIVPPPSWTPPCPLKEKGIWENSRFATRVQQVDKLQNRDTGKKMCRNRGAMMRKRRKLLKMGEESSTERFGFEPGPQFTLESFQKYADDFKQHHFRTENKESDLSSSYCEPSVENIEGEYWRIVEKPTEQIEVLYGADLETGTYGSGFPKVSAATSNCEVDDPYVKSGWNLNNLPRLPSSVLSFESGDISGVLVPWLYIGMCFSSFCWHVEDHHLYSLNYMHWGSPKVWYGVPGKDAFKLEAAMKKHLAALFEEQPDLLHNLVTQFSPSILKLEGVPVYRCVQHPGEFVLTFPRAYHSGFNCGFNCAEAVNVAPVDWLPQGQNAVELYREQSRKISISHDKLLLEAAREAVKAQWNLLFLKNNTLDNLRWKDFCGPDGILAKALKVRIEMEKVRREHVSCSSQSRKMDSDFNSSTERECFLCHYDLHLSAAGCPCSPDKFACLVHAQQLCSCPMQTRLVLFRYEINEMNLLLDALGGKLSAIHRWGISDLGLSLSSYVNKDKGPAPKPISKTTSEVTKLLNHGAVTHGRPTIARMVDSFKQESKSSIQHQPLQGHNRIETSNVNLDSSSVNQRTKSMVMSEVSLHEEGKVQNILPSVHRDRSPDTLDHQHSEDGLRKRKSLDNVSGEQKAFNCSFLSANENFNNLNLTETKIKEEGSCGIGNIISIGDDEHEGIKTSSVKVKKEVVMENPDVLARLKFFDNSISTNSENDQVLRIPDTSASEMSVRDTDLIPIAADLVKPVSTEVKEEKEGCSGGEILLNSYDKLYAVSQNACNSNKSAETLIMQQTAGLVFVKDGNTCVSTNIMDHLQESPLPVSGKSSCESKDKRNQLDTKSSLVVDRGETALASTSYAQSSFDRHNRLQKGPRIAKVVRRVNCTVEPLDYGSVLPGKLWSTSHVIFPKGYRSRVRYLSILDPNQMCHYICEIIDAGLSGPLFMVILEQCPSEVFIHASPTKCWDMVRERVNNEIRRLHSMGRVNLPSLQPPGSVDGLDMYGLSSPSVIQAIEAMDKNHVCTEYWRTGSQAVAQPTQATLAERDEQKQSLLDHANVALQRLFKKAQLEELDALCNMLTSGKPDSRQDIMRILYDEIESRRK